MTWAFCQEIMKKNALIAALLAVSFPVCQAANDNTKANGSPGPTATAVAKTHLRSILEGDNKKLADTYAAKIVLMPGHELLKEEHGLAGPKGRKEAMTVTRTKLLITMEKAREEWCKPPVEKIDELLKTLAFESIKVEIGDNATDPSDPVDTPDGKLHFKIKDGDALVKVAPPKGDFLLFQLRQIDGKWRVVAEYLD